MATHSSILMQKILWPEEPGGLQSTGSQRVGPSQDCRNSKYSSLLVTKFFPLIYGT